MAKTLCYDDGFTFPIGLGRPREGRALRSVAIVRGVPELRFDQSDHTPSLTEDEVAAICRLVSEGVRPQFTFIGIPFVHPFYGRQYKEYDPSWLNGTALGELLFEVDWKMKCLNIGLQTDEAKSVFFSREKTSKTKGLATFLDFDSPDTDGSIFLSCGDVPVQLYNDELVFNVDPKLSIDAKSWPNYSNYINRVLPQIAEHDEPLFTKFQEVLKMLLAAEWLHEKGIEMSEKWMTNATCNSKKQIAVFGGTVECHDLSTNAATKSSTVNDECITSLDVSPNEEEAKNCRRVAASSGGVWYGWLDHGSGEMVQFTEEGKLCAEIRSVRMCVTQWVMVDGEKLSMEDWVMKGGMLRLLDVHTQHEQDVTSYREFSELFKVETHVSDGPQCKETTTTLEIYPGTKLVTVIKASAKDLNSVYKDLPTGFPVDSWNDLFDQTVPWPRVWLTSRDGAGILTFSGGVRTDSVRAVPEKPRDGEQLRRKADQNPYTVESRMEGSIYKVPEHTRLSVLKCFQERWKKDPMPTVVAIFGITNGSLEQTWKSYQSCLIEKRGKRYQSAEPYFHGTALKCDISNNTTLCSLSSCSICGIANEGFKEELISEETFQRFGKGFYLAPDSSKSNDYTQEFNSKGIPHRALLLCDVCPGKKYPLTKNDQKLQGPPPGYDSVYGQVGGDLNFPEIVVYNSAAIMPRFVIVYK